MEVESEKIRGNISDLKIELKKWEHAFEALNGKPPSRQDIKGNKEMCMYSGFQTMLKIATNYHYSCS